MTVRSRAAAEGCPLPCSSLRVVKFPALVQSPCWRHPDLSILTSSWILFSCHLLLLCHRLDVPQQSRKCCRFIACAQVKLMRGSVLPKQLFLSLLLVCLCVGGIAAASLTSSLSWDVVFGEQEVRQYLYQKLFYLRWYFISKLLVGCCILEGTGAKGDRIIFILCTSN